MWIGKFLSQGSICYLGPGCVCKHQGQFTSPSCEELTHGKRLWCWRDWGQEEKGTTEDEMAGWHHWLDGRGSVWTLLVCDGQGGLACCDSWGRRVGHDWATELNWTIIGFSLKGITNTSDSFLIFFTGEEGAAGSKRVGREKEIASWPGNLDRRGYWQSRGRRQSQRQSAIRFRAS